MALPANALTTIAVIEGELGLTPDAQDELLERLIGVVSDAIEREALRSFQRDAARVDNLTGHGTIKLIVELAPIRTVTKIEFVGIDGTVEEVIDAATYVVNEAGAGFVERITGTWGFTGSSARDISRTPLPDTERRRWRVTYDGGFVLPKDDGAPDPRTLPFDLEQAAIDGVVSMYRRRGKPSGLKSEKQLSWAASFTDADASSMLPSSSVAIAKKYRRPVLI